MPPPNIKLGEQAGEHGSYSFYHSFRYLSKGKWRHIQLGKFFFVRVSKDSPVCIGELQLVWTSKHTYHPLTSVRLYYLPEQTPEGRQSHHGQNELIATEKIVLHAKDLIKWISVEGVDWNLGLPFFKQKNSSCQCHRKDGLSCNVQVLNFPNYCRVTTALKRIEQTRMTVEEAVCSPELSCIYGLKTIIMNSYVMFCRETFDNPELERHEYRCDHLAPNLKGRPRKKTNSRHSHTSPAVKKEPASTQQRSVVESTPAAAKGLTQEEKLKQLLSSRDKFTKALYQFMSDDGTPITKVPSLGFKKVDLYLFFQHAHNLGGYQQICQKRLWKHLYDQMGGNPHNTSAANCTKRQYERLLLRFENHLSKKFGGSFISKSSVNVKSLRKVERMKSMKEKKEVVSTTGTLSPCKQDEEVSHRSLRFSERLPKSVVEDKRPKSPMEIQDEASENSLTIEEKDVDQTENSTTFPKSLATSVVSTNSTWKVPVETQCSSNSESPMPVAGLATATTLVTTTLVATTTTTTTVAASVPAMISQSTAAGPRKISLNVCKTPVEERITVPAHCVQKAPMPLNVLGPCHPSKLMRAQRSPWTVLMTSSYCDPYIVRGNSGPAVKISELKRHCTDEAVDLSVKRRRPSFHLPPSKPAEAIPSKPDCGAIDLSVKKQPSSSNHEVKPSFAHPPSSEPLNFITAKHKVTSSPYPPPLTQVKLEPHARDVRRQYQPNITGPMASNFGSRPNPGYGSDGSTFYKPTSDGSLAAINQMSPSNCQSILMSSPSAIADPKSTYSIHSIPLAVPPDFSRMRSVDHLGGQTTSAVSSKSQFSPLQPQPVRLHMPYVGVGAPRMNTPPVSVKSAPPRPPLTSPPLTSPPPAHCKPHQSAIHQALRLNQTTKLPASPNHNVHSDDNKGKLKMLSAKSEGLGPRPATMEPLLKAEHHHSPVHRVSRSGGLERPHYSMKHPGIRPPMQSMQCMPPSYAPAPSSKPSTMSILDKPPPQLHSYREQYNPRLASEAMAKYYSPSHLTATSSIARPNAAHQKQPERLRTSTNSFAQHHMPQQIPTGMGSINRGLLASDAAICSQMQNLHRNSIQASQAAMAAMSSALPALPRLQPIPSHHLYPDPKQS